MLPPSGRAGGGIASGRRRVGMIIGIFGGIGSGKSTVLNILKEEYKAHIIEADKIAHALYLPGEEGYRIVLSLLGEEVLNEDGSLNRKRMGEILFQNSSLLAALNEKIHPRVRERIVEEIRHISADSENALKEEKEEKRRQNFVKPLIAVEAALLMPELDELFDRKIYIYADRESRIERLAQERNYSREKTLRIMENQPSEEEYRAYCDLEIDNGQSREDIASRIKALF